MLDPDLLRSFVAAADTLNFSKAAQRVGRVQSAVSLQIVRLEEVTGQRLFERGRGRAMTLTTAGTRLLPYAHRLLRLNAEALTAMRPTHPARALRFGTTETYAASILPKALAAARHIDPSIEIAVTCTTSAALVEALNRDEIDAALLTDQSRGSDRISTHRLSLVWASGPGWHRPTDGPLPLALMPEGCEFRRAALAALHAYDIPWRVALSSPSPSGIRAALLADMAVAVLPRPCVDDAIRIVGLQSGLPALEDVTVTLHYRCAEPHAFMDAVESELKDALRNPDDIAMV